ncbi:MAG: heavy-metal-associated domain-containing protein [Acidobacteria bacterium]|nr:heavy-metal-associated domain-containing protein [Acidobacteriota bacterium]
MSVKGMVCSICARQLQNRLLKVAGVDGVGVDIDKQTAVLKLKPNTDLTEPQIRAAVEDAGFTVTAVTWRGESSVASRNGTTAEFKIDGMHCTLCAANLARVLKEQPGVESARVDFEKKLALVQYDATKTTTEQIEKTRACFVPSS